MMLAVLSLKKRVGGPAVWLTVILGLHLVLGLVYDWATPIFEAPDEGYHFALAHWLGQGNGLPVQQPGQKTEWAQEGSQPPLYHWLVAGLTAGVDMRDWRETFVWNPRTQMGLPTTTHNVNLYRHTLAQAFPYTGTTLAVHIARWFSLALSLVTIFLTYRLARQVFTAQEKVALLAAALVAFNPKAIFINASVNNDNLLMLLSTAALLGCVHFMQANVKYYGWKALGLGMLLGLAALTKVSGLVLWPVAALAVGWGAWQARDGRRFVISGVLIASAALLVSGWWFWRNYVLYNDWLGLSTMVAVAGPRVPAITLWELIWNEWWGCFLSYWSVFGVFTILPAAWVHVFFTGLMVWALVGGGFGLVVGRAWSRPALGLLALFCALTLAGLISWTMQTFASQGRLLFGAIAPLSIFMAAGLLLPLSWLGTHRVFNLGPWSFDLGSLSFGIFVFILVLVSAIIPVVYIAPRYAPPPLLSAEALPAELKPVHVVFGEKIELVGYTAAETPQKPGGEQSVTLYWRALAPMAKDYVAALHLLGRGVEEVGKIDTWPGGGNAPTSQWKPGDIFADTYRMPIDKQAQAPALLKLSLEFWDGEPANRLAMTAPDGTELKMVMFQAGRVVPAVAPSVAPALIEGSTFEYGIKLLGVDFGERGRLVLYWQADQIVPAAYTVFLHLQDAQGQPVAQADAPPLNGDWPTSAWVPGLAFADSRQFDLPSGLPAGRYTLQLGFYDPASGARLAAYRRDGTEWPDNIVVIEGAVKIP